MLFNVRFPESWSSTSLAKNAVLGTAKEIFVLDNAFALIEGQPSVGKGPKGWASPPKKMAR